MCFPCIFGTNREVILKYLKENESKNITANIINITEQGQSWILKYDNLNVLQESTPTSQRSSEYPGKAE